MPEAADPDRPDTTPIRSRGPYLIGVTGPIASGKSLLVRLLAGRHGLPVLDADRMGREAIGPAGAACESVLARFGDAIRGPGGSIDRARLGAIVFRDPTALAALEAISHPVILASITEQVAALKAGGYAGMILLDAAVLPRWRDRLSLAALVLVRAAADVRLNRLLQRGWDREEARRRIAAQDALFGPDLAADRIIDNQGTMESLELATAALWRELTDRFGGSERSKSA